MRKNRELNKERYGFIVTKPLQLMVVFAIIEQLPKKSMKELIVVDAFKNSEKVTANLGEYGKRWGKAAFVDTHGQAYKYASGAGYSKLFIDSDVGLRKYLQLVLIKALNTDIVIAVYEEGLGTYRNDLYKGLKKKCMM